MTLAHALKLRSVESLGVNRDGTFAARIAAAPTEFETTPRASDDLAAILYTSGTTGRSKGAMLTHENLSSNALTLIDCWRFSSADRLIHALPVFHTHGLFVAVNVALLSGATMIFMQKFDPDAVIAALPESTAMMGVPTFYTRLLDHPGLNRDVCANMRLFVSGSAPLLAETHAAWRERTGFAILERYGMTETNMITSNPYDGDRRAGTVGFALPSVSVRVADPESGTPVEAGEVGVIEVKGPNVFAGYWRMPEKTSQEFRADGYFITGDLARVDDDGYIHIVGRAKDLVISGGFNVYPKEVETEIDALEGVLESAVFGVPHADFGEAVTAAVVARPGAVLSESAILSALGSRLAKFKAPKQIVLVEFSAAQRNGQGAKGGAEGSLQGHLPHLGEGRDLAAPPRTRRRRRREPSGGLERLFSDLRPYARRNVGSLRSRRPPTVEGKKRRFLWGDACFSRRKSLPTPSGNHAVKLVFLPTNKRFQSFTKAFPSGFPGSALAAVGGRFPWLCASFPPRR